MRRSLTSFAIGTREAWGLTKPYFTSEERWSATGLLAAVMALNLFQVFMLVVLNYWNRDFFNAIQAKDRHSLFALIFTYQQTPGFPGFMPNLIAISTVLVVDYVYATYLMQMLQIRWRRWMTKYMVKNWLSDKAYYRISLANQQGSIIDNPDQRIAEDIRDFTFNSINLSTSFLGNVVNAFTFAFVLYAVSGPITLLGITIPGYMFWVAVLYCVFGTMLTHLIGRRLIPLSFLMQKLEANFRYNLVRVRDNLEGIALYAGEDGEQLSLLERFEAVRANFWLIMRRTKILNFFTQSYNQIANIFPLIVALPRYLSGAIGFGGLTQIQDAFSNFQGSLSWIISVYSDSTTNQDLVNLRATIARLHGFKEAVAAARAASLNGPQLTQEGAALTFDNLTLSLPDGRKLIENQSLSLPAGEPVLLTGPSGAGKSTLFRAIAGIWPFGAGTISRPAGTALFLPQKPYFPLGSLKRAVAYPALETSVTDDAVRAALANAELPLLADRLNDIENWGQNLSGGEQQRLAIARALLTKPNWLFLDEATSALDAPTATRIHQALLDHLPGTTIIAITHRDVSVTPTRHFGLADGALEKIK